jgi:hypothetical protein
MEIKTVWNRMDNLNEFTRHCAQKSMEIAMHRWYRCPRYPLPVLGTPVWIKKCDQCIAKRFIMRKSYQKNKEQILEKDRKRRKKKFFEKRDTLRLIAAAVAATEGKHV